MELNGLTVDVIRVGQELLIPAETGVATQPPQGVPSPEATKQSDTTTYVVQAGDTLTDIAKRFNVSLDAIMEANGITEPDSISEGQELVVPAPLSSLETPGIGGAPTPTTASQLVYGAPLLLGPPDGQEFREEQAELPILLNWLSVGLLGDDEWYSVTVRGLGSEGEEWKTVEFTKANSYHVSAESRPSPDAQSHAFEWEVRVVQLTETGVDDNPEVRPIGRRSEARTFHWY